MSTSMLVTKDCLALLFYALLEARKMNFELRPKELLIHLWFHKDDAWWRSLVS